MHEHETPNEDTGAATVNEALNKGGNVFATVTLVLMTTSVIHSLYQRSYAPLAFQRVIPASRPQWRPQNPRHLPMRRCGY
jgi:hypothetical protein